MTNNLRFQDSKQVIRQVGTRQVGNFIFCHRVCRLQQEWAGRDFYAIYDFDHFDSGLPTNSHFQHTTDTIDQAGTGQMGFSCAKICEKILLVQIANLWAMSSFAILTIKAMKAKAGGPILWRCSTQYYSHRSSSLRVCIKRKCVRVSGTCLCSTMKKWVEGKLNKTFLHFSAKLLPYLMNFPGGVPEGTAELHQIWPTFDKHEEKPCSTILVQLARLQPICQADSR